MCVCVGGGGGQREGHGVTYTLLTAFLAPDSTGPIAAIHRVG